MLEWIITAMGIGIGITGLAAYVKTNLEARQRERELHETIDDLRDDLKRGQLIGKERVITEDKKLINSAQKEVWILGINALAPLHQCREDLIALLKKKGIVKVLLLNPESDAFKQRERDEEEIDGKISGRPRAEYAASVAICKDIVHFSHAKGKFELRIRNIYPEYAVIIRDPKSDKCRAHKNYYPKEKMTRGLSGEHRAIFESWPDALDPLIGSTRNCGIKPQRLI
jgi:hypothetical protein